ncbi:hypothetical protein AAGV28_02360 [Flavobacterium sp. FZUC8N2.13]|uniref:Uncharacterized protein n=1 Tax=Flavobacterium zubiriense TaxID=3138075 RepID=A0ABV4TBC2_9FLAO
MKYLSISSSRKHIFILFFSLLATLNSWAACGKWTSKVTGGTIEYTTTESKNPIKDFNGNYLTVVYLKNLAIKKIGRNSIKKDVNWLLAEGYRVIELNYSKNTNAKALKINEDIIAINDSIAALLIWLKPKRQLLLYFFIIRTTMLIMKIKLFI